MLPKMVNFVANNKSRSILSRIYGIYAVKMKGVKAVDLVL